MIYCFLLWNRFGSSFCYKVYLCVLFGTIEVLRIMCLCILLPWYGLGLASLWSFQYIQSFTLFICHIKPQFSLLVWKKKQESVDKKRCENESKRIKGGVKVSYLLLYPKALRTLSLSLNMKVRIVMIVMLNV